MYLVNNIDQIHHLMNEPKKLIFAYNSDWREYIHKKSNGRLNMHETFVKLLPIRYFSFIENTPSGLIYKRNLGQLKLMYLIKN
jgi:hypothetical protein